MPFTANGYYERGLERLKEKNYIGAEKDFLKVIIREPDNAAAYYQRVIVKSNLMYGF